MSHSLAGYARLAGLPFGPHLLRRNAEPRPQKNENPAVAGSYSWTGAPHVFPSCNVKFEFSTLRPYLYTTFGFIFVVFSVTLTTKLCISILTRINCII